MFTPPPPDSYFAGPQLELAEALHGHDARRAEALVRSGAPLNAPGRGGVLPLSYLITAKDPAGIKLAVRLGADPVAEVRARGTPLALAAQQKDPAALQALLDAGANPNPKLAEPLIHTAGFASAFENIRLLVARGADINAVNQGGDTLLVSALLQGDMDLALLALDLGCDPRKPNRFGVTAERLAGESWAAVRQRREEKTARGRKVEAVVRRLQAAGLLRGPNA